MRTLRKMVRVALQMPIDDSGREPAFDGWYWRGKFELAGNEDISRVAT